MTELKVTTCLGTWKSGERYSVTMSQYIMSICDYMMAYIIIWVNCGSFQGFGLGVLSWSFFSAFHRVFFTSMWRFGSKIRKKPSSFYVRAAATFLRGTRSKDPVEELRVSGLGLAVQAAMEVATRMERDGVGTLGLKNKGMSSEWGFWTSKQNRFWMDFLTFGFLSFLDLFQTKFPQTFPALSFWSFSPPGEGLKLSSLLVLLSSLLPALLDNTLEAFLGGQYRRPKGTSQRPRNEAR